MNTQNYQRRSRHLSPETKAKISRSLTGRPKTIAHKEAIRQGELRYWRNDDNFPDDNYSAVTINDIML